VSAQAKKTEETTGKSTAPTAQRQSQAQLTPQTVKVDAPAKKK
jgi:hypothetical protein